ncbi:ECF transporter S component [Candidatus Bathyarchaeota archaeon]|nr:ECF transporter S component [Candidatus Bathyarchaeota archaeon]
MRLQDALVRVKTLDTRDYSLIASFSALMAITTAWAFPLPFGGLMHFGNVVMWTASILFGGLIGGLAGGIGGMIVDILEAPIWAPFTPLCKLASGLACGLVAGESATLDHVKFLRIVAATIVGSAVNTIAYAPVYYFLLGPSSMWAWLLLFLSPTPTRILSYIATVILSIGALRVYPGISSYRKSVRQRIEAYGKAEEGR